MGLLGDDQKIDVIMTLFGQMRPVRAGQNGFSAVDYFIFGQIPITPASNK